jgi:hypothetical protein
MSMKKFLVHKRSAKERHIGFKFTYEEWVAWWETNLGPDWINKRGCKRGQYVMARKGDKGPYAPWNVECVTCSENIVGRPPKNTRFISILEKTFKAKPLQSTATLSDLIKDQDTLYESLQTLIRHGKIRRIKYACYKSLINDTDS